MIWSCVRFSVLATLIGFAYAYTWYWLYIRWTAADSFFAHGFIVPFIFLWLLYRRKEALAHLEPAPDLRGLLLVVPALLIHLMAVHTEVYSPSGFTLPVLLAGIVLYFWGWARLKLLLFPILFCFFAIPLPMTWVQSASFRLKIIAMHLSTGLAGIAGVETREQGSYIFFNSGEHLLVGSPCSGLRSLVALTALGFLYALEFLPLNALGRMIFIVLAVPIAMISNVLRITFLCLVAEHFGVPATTGIVHDASGYGIYLVALLLMIASGRIMSAIPFFKGRKA
ncbi:MAG: exosortase/archaeosortase family protein [Planctomycetota bacterium]